MFALTYLLVFGSVVHALGEWVRIAQNAEHHDTDLDRAIGGPSLLLAPDTGPTQNFGEPKYEDALDAIGHDLGSDFRTRDHSGHFRRIDKNRRLYFNATSKRYSGDSRKSSTLYYPNDKYIDPWAIYDRPMTSTPMAIKVSSLLETNVEWLTTADPPDANATPLSVFSSNVHAAAPQRNKTIVLTNKTRLTANANRTTTKPRKTSTVRVQRKPAHTLVPTQVILKHVDFKPFDFSGILKFFSSIQQSFSLGSIARVGDKVNFLQDFRDRLLSNIGERLMELWPTKPDAEYRERRSVSGGSHSMDFPSAETALMTISFLTLAVFLIKLVLQVIHTIKSKHVGYGAMQSMVAHHSLGGAGLMLNGGGLSGGGLSANGINLGGGTSGMAGGGGLGYSAGGNVGGLNLGALLGGGAGGSAAGGSAGLGGMGGGGVFGFGSGGLNSAGLGFGEMGSGESMIKIIKKSRDNEEVLLESGGDVVLPKSNPYENGINVKR